MSMIQRCLKQDSHSVWDDNYSALPVDLYEEGKGVSKGLLESRSTIISKATKHPSDIIGMYTLLRYL